jgi:hypothetical protein
LTPDLVGKRLVDLSTAAVVRVIPEAVVTVAVVGPARMYTWVTNISI